VVCALRNQAAILALMREAEKTVELIRAKVAASEQ